MGYILYVIFAVLAIGLFRLLIAPLGWIVKLVVHSVLGLIGLLLVNLLGSLIGISIEITLLNVLIVGFLGLFGVAFLIFM